MNDKRVRTLVVGSTLGTGSTGYGPGLQARAVDLLQFGNALPSHVEVTHGTGIGELGNGSQGAVSIGNEAYEALGRKIQQSGLYLRFQIPAGKGSGGGFWLVKVKGSRK